MKKHLLFASALMIFSSCNKPAERPAVLNKDVASNIYAISELADVTGADKKIMIKANNIAGLDAKFKQVKIEGKLDAVLKKVTGDLSKPALEAQLASGSVAMVILKDKIMLYKVVNVAAPATPPATIAPANPPGSQNGSTTPPGGTGAVAGNLEDSATPDGSSQEALPNASEAAAPQDLRTLKYLTKLKEQSKEQDARVQADLASQLDAAKAERPQDIGETVGFAELTSIDITKVGILDNERTEYGEKKSTLNVIEGPFELATHILLDNETGVKKANGDVTAP